MSLHTTQENTQSLETVVSSGEANTNYNADWRELSADLVLYILSYLRIDQSHVNELKSNAYKLLYGYFADDPNREIHFLYCHFSIRRGAASTTGNENRAMSAQDSFSCIFKNAAHLSVRLDDIDHCPAIFSALRENWKLVRLENESQQIKSSSLLIQSLDDCKPKLQHFSSHVATEEDLDHLSMFDQLQNITIRMLSLSGEHAEMHAELQSIELQRQAEALATNQQNENGEDEVMQVSSLPPLFDLAGVLKDHWHHLSYLELNTLGTKVAEQMVDLRLVLGGHLRSIFSHSSIQTLVLSNQMIKATDLDSFCENEAMVSLNLSGCTFADRKTLQNLAANPFLKSLKLIGCSLTSALASCLFESNTYAHGSFASLEKLSLAVNPKITSRLTKLISATSKNEFVLPKLKHLNMSGCKLGSLGAIGVANLVSKSIKLLYMKSCGITDEGLVGMLKACPELMSISLCDNKISLQGLSKEYMGLCPNMRRIKLQRNCISSDGALWLAKQFDSATRLWSMEMDHNANLGDEGASHLLSCLALKRLSLNECNITDRFILDNFQDREQMTQSRLLEVCLIGNRITDTGARVLLDSPLQRVLLSRNKQLTEDSVYHLLSSRTLQKIWMEGLPLVSAQVKQNVMDHVKQLMADQIYSIRL